MSEDPRTPVERDPVENGAVESDPGERDGGEPETGGDSFIDRHLGKIVAAGLLVGLLGVAARALVA